MPQEGAENSYQPHQAIVAEIIEENSQIKTFVLRFVDEKDNRSFTYSPGQFMMVSILHQGEAPISFSSTPSRPGTISLSVRRAGKLTGAMHDLEQGAIIGLRGPFGKPFPVADFKGRDLLFVAGGIGLAPLRSTINYCMDQGDEYGQKIILYGSRSPEDIAFAADLAEWRKRKDTTCLLTVDQAEPKHKWQGHVGLVTELLDDIDLDIEQATALVCGPPLMIRFVIAKLSRLGFKEEDIITTLERHMKCGIGVCGHCHMDDKLVCVDGPVFTHSQLVALDVMELRP